MKVMRAVGGCAVVVVVGRIVSWSELIMKGGGDVGEVRCAVAGRGSPAPERSEAGIGLGGAAVGGAAMLSAVIGAGVALSLVVVVLTGTSAFPGVALAAALLCLSSCAFAGSPTCTVQMSKINLTSRKATWTQQRNAATPAIRKTETSTTKSPTNAKNVNPSLNAAITKVWYETRLLVDGVAHFSICLLSSTICPMRMIQNAAVIRRMSPEKTSSFGPYSVSALRI